MNVWTVNNLLIKYSIYEILIILKCTAIRKKHIYAPSDHFYYYIIIIMYIYWCFFFYFVEIIN